jgi:beta-lactamase class D
MHKTYIVVSSLATHNGDLAWVVGWVNKNGEPVHSTFAEPTRNVNNLPQKHTLWKQFLVTVYKYLSLVVDGSKL